MSSVFGVDGLGEGGVSEVQRKQIRQYGLVLGIVHIVMGVLTALFGLFFLIYVGMGVLMLTGNFGPASGGPDVTIAGGMVTAVGAMGTLICLAVGALQVYAGLSFIRFKNHTFLIVMQVLNLLNQPLGLVLGIFGFLFLLNKDAKVLFDEGKRGGGADPDVLA